MADIAVTRVADGRFRVQIHEGASTTVHDVTVTSEYASRIALDVEPARLVEASFRFLLERESKESILRSFDLPVIGRYFPEYEREMRRRLS